jgi:hypothetical protein
MDSDGRLTLPIPSPTTQERAAFRLVGAYLRRARQVATQRLLAEQMDDDLEELITLSAYLLTSSRLCDVLALLPMADRSRWGGAMDGFDPSALQLVAGFLLLTLLFVVRELASGALKEAGKELWGWTRRRRQMKVDGNTCRDS